VIFRDSRVIWIHLERDACPTDFSAGPHEKMRLQQLRSSQEDPPR
jgi:hypothetical protein